jgi:hypothetical protein
MQTSRYGLASLALVACWTSTPVQSTTPTVAKAAEPAGRDLTGPYWCSIDTDGYEYPRYPCAIKKVGGALVLAKLGGSQRIRGRIQLDERDGFSFSGELYCPWGDCTQQLNGTFTPAGRGYKGSFREESMVVTLMPASDGEFGGVDYAGDEGGDPFDLDTAMGGASYGGGRNYRIDSRGRRGR